jgi:hypothetical protein
MTGRLRAGIAEKSVKGTKAYEDTDVVVPVLKELNLVPNVVPDLV